MAARAHRVVDQAEAEQVIRILPLKYPDAPPQMAAMQMPTPEDVALFRVVPEVISVLDYTRGFAHTDLVTCGGAPPAAGLALAGGVSWAACRD